MFAIFTSFVCVDQSPLQILLILVDLIAEIFENAINNEEGVKEWPFGLDVLKLLRHPFRIKSSIFRLENTTVPISFKSFDAELTDLIAKRRKYV